YYRGYHAVPRFGFYMNYFWAPRPVVAYYTPFARLAYLRSWAIRYRTTPAYIGWRTGFIGWRAGYAGRFSRLHSTYGVSRFGARIGFSRPVVRPVVRASVHTSFRPAVRASVHTSFRPAVRAGVRMAPRAHMGGHISRPAPRVHAHR